MSSRPEKHAHSFFLTRTAREREHCGTSAASLNDRVDDPIARREAEELGLKDQRLLVGGDPLCGRLGAIAAERAAYAQNPAAVPSASISAGPQSQLQPARERSDGRSTRNERGPSPRALVARRSQTATDERRADPSRRSLRLAAVRRRHGDGPQSPSRVLDEQSDPNRSGKGSGQSAGTGASTEITSRRVGCVNFNCRAWSAIR